MKSAACVKENVKVNLPYARCEGVWNIVGIAPLIINLDNILCRVVSFMTLAALPLGKNPQYP